MNISLKISCIFLSIFIAGCGDELTNLTGAVSIGGSGTGQNTPSSGATNPPPTSGEFFLNFNIYSPGIYEISCENLEITSYFLNNVTGEPILAEGSIVSVPMLQSTTDTNVSIQVNVKNNSDYPIYEYRSNCSVPVTLKDINQKIYIPQSDTVCQNTDDEYQIILPKETKTFKLKYSIPLKVQSWNLQYSSSHSLNQFMQSNERTTCSDFSVDFSVVK